MLSEFGKENSEKLNVFFCLCSRLEGCTGEMTAAIQHRKVIQNIRYHHVLPLSEVTSCNCCWAVNFSVHGCQLSWIRIWIIRYLQKVNVKVCIIRIFLCPFEPVRWRKPSMRWQCMCPFWQDVFCVQFTKLGSDSKVLEEMMFGSVGMAYKGSTLKVHFIR